MNETNQTNETIPTKKEFYKESFSEEILVVCVSISQVYMKSQTYLIKQMLKENSESQKRKYVNKMIAKLMHFCLSTMTEKQADSVFYPENAKLKF